MYHESHGASVANFVDIFSVHFPVIWASLNVIYFHLSSAWSREFLLSVQGDATFCRICWSPFSSCALPGRVAKSANISSHLLETDKFQQIYWQNYSCTKSSSTWPDIWRLWNLSWIVWRKRWRMKLNATRPPSTRQGFSDIWFMFGTGLAPDNPGIRHKNSQQSKCDHTLIQLSWGKRS